MAQESIFINTKLLPPSIPDIIHRDRFDLLVSQFKDNKLITVTSGAGYGKTTFVFDALNQLHAKAVWYRLDASDKDFTTFIHYLSTGIKNIYAEFASQLFSLLSNPIEINRKHEYFLSLFINDLTKISHEDLYLVLDDYHLIQNSPDIKNALKFILQHLPSGIHLILTSRSSIDLPLSRLRAKREVLDMDEKDLCFTDSETRKLFLETFGISISEEYIKVLHKQTNGWISGLILFYHMLKGKSESAIEKFLKNIKGPSGDIYSYIEENVFDQLSSDHRAFLIKTSILSRLNPKFCDQFLDINQSKKILRYLKENHLFTFLMDSENEEYIYHDLLKDFLGEKLKSLYDEKEIKQFYTKAARLFETNSETKTALEYYVQAGCIEDTRRLIPLFAFQWFSQGKVEQIRWFLDKIPENHIQTEPLFLYLQAGLLWLLGNSEESIVVYHNALELYRNSSSKDGFNICLLQLAISYYFLGDYAKAEPLLKEFISQKSLTPNLKILGLGYLIMLSGNLGKPSDSRDYIEKAMDLLSDISEEKTVLPEFIWASIARNCVSQGRLFDAFEYVEKALRTLQHSEDYRLLSLCYLLQSEIYFRLGRYHKGRDAAIKALDIAEKQGFKDRAFETAYFFLGFNCLGLDMGAEGLQYAKKCLSLSRKIKNSVSQAYANILLFHYYYFHSGELSRAEQVLREGFSIIKGKKMPDIQCQFEIYLATIMNEKGRPDAAFELLQKAQEKSAPYLYLQALSQFVLTRCYQTCNQMDQAVHTFLKALTYCEEYGYDSLLLQPKRLWTISLMVEVYAMGEKKNYIRKILMKMGPKVRGELSNIIKGKAKTIIKDTAAELFNELRHELAVELNVQCFGKFRLFIGETELHVAQWKSKKAIQLFKYLAFSRQRGFLDKEVLMELLWPEDDPQKSSNRFHVLLASMRKDLEPNLPKGVPSTYIQSNGGTYLLEIGQNGRIDIEDFSQEIKKAKTGKDPVESIQHYMNAISLYQGDFLEEDLYVDWCMEARDRYKEDYLYALKEVIKFYELKKEFDKCIEYSTFYLKTDNCAEDIYQALMRCYFHQGDNAMMIKTFERCKKNILNELNCPLSQETLELYQQLHPN